MLECSPHCGFLVVSSKCVLVEVGSRMSGGVDEVKAGVIEIVMQCTYLQYSCILHLIA